MVRKKKIKYINVDKRNIIKIYEELPEIVKHSPKDYGLSDKYSGKNVKIALLDSGTPHHKDIKVKGESVNLCGSKDDKDKYGHSTMINGIICANNNKGLVGISPNSEILNIKVIDNKGNANFNSIVSGVLWAIVKKVDIICLPLGSQYDYSVLHDVIIKAHKENILIIASAGNKIKNKKSKVEYPANYNKCFSVCSLNRLKRINNIISEKVDFTFPYSSYYTTYLDNKYVEAGGSSISTAFITGIVSILIEKFKKEKKKVSYKSIYNNLSKILRN